MEATDFGLLVSLDALLQEGSVTSAARRVGLSTPAMSHALARMRERLGDPLLVRSGRGMVLTPRAEALKARVHTLVNEARQTLEPERPMVAAELRHTFVIHATDYVLTMLGPILDRLLRAEAPHVCLRFVPNTSEDAAQLRAGSADLAVGIYGELPQELRSRQLLTDRFVCVARKEHPVVGSRLSLQQSRAKSIRWLAVACLCSSLYGCPTSKSRHAESREVTSTMCCTSAVCSVKWPAPFLTSSPRCSWQHRPTIY